MKRLLILTILFLAGCSNNEKIETGFDYNSSYVADLYDMLFACFPDKTYPEIYDMFNFANYKFSTLLIVENEPARLKFNLSACNMPTIYNFTCNADKRGDYIYIENDTIVFLSGIEYPIAYTIKLYHYSGNKLTVDVGFAGGAYLNPTEKDFRCCYVNDSNLENATYNELVGRYARLHNMFINKCPIDSYVGNFQSFVRSRRDKRMEYINILIDELYIKQIKEAYEK